MNNTTSNKWVEIYSPVRVKYKELVLEINNLESVKGNMTLKTEDLFLEIHLNAKEKVKDCSSNQ